MELLLNDITQYIDIVYILLCNIFTYLILTAIPNGKELENGWKRLISTITATIVGWICIVKFGHDHESIFVSFFLQFLMYDYVLRAFFKKLDAGEFDKKDHEKIPDEKPEA